MALILQHEVEEQTGCQKWNFIDTTGTYNVSTNVGGYGAPNATINSVTSATITILPYQSTVGYVFTFTIVNGTITACTVTNPTGVVTNIYSLLTSTVFPFSDTNPFVIIADWLGFGVDSQFTSNAYNFEYVVTGGYTSSSDDLMVCQTCCCVEGMTTSLEPTDCDCQSDKLDNAIKARIFLDSAVWAMEDGDVDGSVNALNFVKNICNTKNCKNC